MRRQVGIYEREVVRNRYLLTSRQSAGPPPSGARGGCSATGLPFHGRFQHIFATELDWRTGQAPKTWSTTGSIANPSESNDDWTAYQHNGVRISYFPVHAAEGARLYPAAAPGQPAGAAPRRRYAFPGKRRHDRGRDCRHKVMVCGTRRFRGGSHGRARDAGFRGAVPGRRLGLQLVSPLGPRG